MNHHNTKLLSTVFPLYYDRVASTKIDIREINRCLEKNSRPNKLPFLSYAIRERAEGEQDDRVYFGEMMGRINESLGSKNDRILIETIMEELDGDEDGYIGVEDVERINEELGCVLSKGEIEKMMERICVDGRKIGKKELEGIMWR